jgi:hypothetical protein
MMKCKTLELIRVSNYAGTMLTIIDMLINHNVVCREPLFQTLEKVKSKDFLKSTGAGKGSVRLSEEIRISEEPARGFQRCSKHQICMVESIC